MARVQVTARRPKAELNSSSSSAPDSGWMATVIRLVWPCQESTVEATSTPSGRSSVSVSRSTMVGRVVDGLVAGGEDDDQRVAVGLARVDAELVRQAHRSRRRCARRR